MHATLSLLSSYFVIASLDSKSSATQGENVSEWLMLLRTSSKRGLKKVRGSMTHLKVSLRAQNSLGCRAEKNPLIMQGRIIELAVTIIRGYDEANEAASAGYGPSLHLQTLDSLCGFALRSLYSPTETA
jgi:hypothetical protein